MLEKFIINRNVLRNSIVLKIFSLKAISVHSLGMFFSRFKNVLSLLIAIELRKTPTSFFGFWDPDLEKKNSKVLNMDDLDLHVSTKRLIFFLKKKKKIVE